MIEIFYYYVEENRYAISETYDIRTRWNTSSTTVNVKE